MSEVAEAEVIETTGVELAERPLGRVSIYRSEDPRAQLEEAKERAAVLVEVIQSQGLAKRFGNNPKPYVQVEGWSFLGSQFGLIADIEWTRELPNGWEARAAMVRIEDGKILSHAEAECRRDEANWGDRASYAIRSMAQTRACSKVFRNVLSSVMVMAGYAATPAEEMDDSYGSSSSGMVAGDSKPKSPDDPHCPGCLAVHGELVPVKHFQAKPPWRCTLKADKCGAPREFKGKRYSWAGWHDTFEASAEEWRNENGYGGPRDVAVATERSNYWAWVLEEIAGSLGQTAEEIKPLAKAALVYVLTENQIDVEAAAAEPILSNDFTEEQLRQIAGNLTAAEAQIVVGAAAELYKPDAN